MKKDYLVYEVLIINLRCERLAHDKRESTGAGHKS